MWCFCSLYLGQKALLPEVMMFPNNREFSTEGNMDDLELPQFDFQAIIDATNFFSLANKLGEGGFGTVYRVSKFPYFYILYTTIDN